MLKNLNKSFFPNNKGQIVIEMCFIMPMIIVVVFVVINMMMTQINKSIALGEIYQVTYNKESYIANSNSDGDVIEVLKSCLENNLTAETNFVNDITVDIDNSGGNVFNKWLNISPGNLQTEVAYDEKNIGIFLILDSENTTKQITVNEEIRDTANNLRRWQLYGRIL